MQSADRLWIPSRVENPAAQGFILLDDANLNPLSSDFSPLGSVITPNLFPGVSISADLGNGPGIQEVATFSVDVRVHTARWRSPTRTAP